MARKFGPFTSVNSAAGAAALVALVAAQSLVSTPPQGTLASLAVTSWRALETSITPVAVIDYGRRDVTLAKHSAANVAAIIAHLDALAVIGERIVGQVEVLAGTTSSPFGITVGGVDVLDGIDAADDTPLGNANMELFRQAFTPQRPKMTAEGFLNALEDLLAALPSEAFVLVDCQNQTIRVWKVADTSPVVAYQTEAAFNAIAGMDALSYITRLHMEPAASTAPDRTVI